MTKKTYIIIAVVILLIITGFMWWNGTQKESQQLPVVQETAQQPVADTTGAIQKDLADINIGDVNTEFTDVDATIKSL